jgi:hypothetical protein
MPPGGEHRGQRADGLSVILSAVVLTKAEAFAAAEASAGSSVPQEEHFRASGIVRFFGSGLEAIQTSWIAKASFYC